MKRIAPEAWRAELEDFYRAAERYYAGDLKRGDYKGISGRFASYAQKADGVSMLRLRMTGGRVSKEKLRFVADAVRKYKVNKIHFTTCQSIQLHNLGLEALKGIMAGTLDAGIVTVGGGGDYPRNVTCEPLAGLDEEEYFDVLPYAEAAAEYAMNFIHEAKLPRKYKIGFAGSRRNAAHATFRDLGFAANADGTFDVYSAGGIGPFPKFGVRVAEHVAPADILKYVKAMWLTFRSYGNYESRAKARSRYMQDTLGGAEAYRAAFLAKLAEAEASGEDFTFAVEPQQVKKTGEGHIRHRRVTAQKQDGLYAVAYHPLGGCPDTEVFLCLADAVLEIPEAELRLAPYETAYIVNLTAAEAQRILDITEADSHRTVFEASSACIGSAICQQGVRDSQALLAACVQAVRAADLPDGALPPVHICGCPSSCTTPQVAVLGLRGAVRDRQSAFVVTFLGDDRRGSERFGRELGLMFEQEIPDFLVKLGQAVASSGLSFAAWAEKNPQGIDEIAVPYLPAR